MGEQRARLGDIPINPVANHAFGLPLSGSSIGDVIFYAEAGTSRRSHADQQSAAARASAERMLGVKLFAARARS
jgi:hypothetical protein